MLQAMHDYDCVLYGHQIAVTSNTTDEDGPPPGLYECTRCLRVVEVKEDETWEAEK